MHKPYSLIESITDRLRSVDSDDPTGEVLLLANERSLNWDLETEANSLALRYTGRPLVENETGDLALGEFPPEE